MKENKISTYTFKEDINLKKWLSNPLCILRKEEARDSKNIYLRFLEITVGGVSNLERIINNYDSFEELEENKSKFLPLDKQSPNKYSELEVKGGTVVYITLEVTNKLNYLLYGNTTTQILPQSTFFIAPALQEMLNNDLFKVSRKIEQNHEVLFQYSRVSVWVWSRTLQRQRGVESSLINLTPFIEKVSLNKGMIEGSVSIDLRPLEGRFYKAESEGNEGFWEIDPNYLKEFNHYVGKSFMTSPSSKSFWNTVIGENDIIFVSLEDLEIDIQENFGKSKTQNRFFIPLEELPRNYFDMIGLIDTVVESRSYSGGSKSATITGRDLSKLFLEDNSYFFPPEHISNGIFATGMDEAGIQRYSGHFIGFTSLAYKSIEESVNFIISALTNAEIAPTELFRGYGDYDGVDLRPQITKVKVRDFKPESFSKEPATGIWQLIKVQIEERISKRNVVDNSIGNQAGSIMEQLQKLAQPPFVELILDTYKNQFYLTYRQAPLTYNAFKELAELCESKFTIDTALGESLTYNKENIYSWYRIIPKGLLGDAGPLQANFKAVRFPEYSEIWGDRSLEVTSNYFMVETEESADTNITFPLEQAIKDLKILVEAYQASPFTRRGTIQILGDRRIKVGTVIYYAPTDEYYLVDNVAHSFTVENGARTTTLTVSRGMVKSYLEKYFNIINTPIGKLLEENKSNTTKNLGTNILEKWSTNLDNFDFFLKRLQFAKI